MAFWGQFQCLEFVPLSTILITGHATNRSACRLLSHQGRGIRGEGRGKGQNAEVRGEFKILHAGLPGTTRYLEFQRTRVLVLNRLVCPWTFGL